MEWKFEPIGVIRSDFKEKFGTPRQPGLVRSARAWVRLRPELRDAVRGLESFSHIWVVFLFDQALKEGWKPLVRPPRLGGSRKIGVLASRSPHRPNAVGLSAVRLLEIPESAPGANVELVVEGGDFVDGTPVLDVKPYVPYADCIPEASSGWAGSQPSAADYEVRFTPESRAQLARLAGEGYSRLEALIREVLLQDPRPAFQAGESGEAGEYSVRLMDFDVHWRMESGACTVTGIDDLRIG